MRASPEPSPPRAAPGSRAVALVAILLALVVAAFEGTVVTSAMPAVVADLGGLGAYAWVFSAFLLASTLGMLTCGKLADAFGRRPVFAAGVGLFLVASALCGGSQSIHQLIVFRALQGLGAGAIQPIAMTISADLYPLRERARVQAVFTTAWGAANVLGPLIGGIIVTRASWRWVFLVNVPIGLAAVAMLFASSYRDPPRAARGPVGAGGAAVAGLSAALLLFALEPGGGLGAGHRLGLAAASAIVAALLVRQQRASEAPILPPSLLLAPVVRAGLLGGLFAGGLLYASAAYVPLWMTQHLGASALTAGAALIPLLVGWAVGSTFGVRVLVRWGMRASVAGGFAVALAGAVMLAAAALADLSTPWVFASLAVLGLGVGPAASTSLIGPQTQVAWRHRGMMTSAVYAARTLGGSLTVAALGSARAKGAAVPSERFAGVALLALAAVTVLALLAPTELREAEREPAPEVGG